MIKLKNLTTNKAHSFEITKFPDGTSQVWKVFPEPFKDDRFQVIWMFEKEEELIHVAQLGALLGEVAEVVHLYVPFMPYARQDKEVANNATFAGSLAVGVLTSVFETVTAFDLHSKTLGYVPGMLNIQPDEFFKAMWGDGPEYSCAVYPDEGALVRYGRLLQKRYVYGEKVRNQQTGQIEGLDLRGDKHVLEGRKVIIFDDICDGGMTFIKMAEKLKEHGAAQIDLCVSHGIFSKGKQVLHDAGITTVLTTNSLLSNPGGYEVVNLEF